jgi:hypothetical protein
MTSQEKELLTRFLQQMNATRAGQKDSEADALIREAVAQQPDAGYLLVQRAMQLEQLLEASQAQVQKLQTELEKSRSGSASAPVSGSFLSDPAWGSRPAAASSAASSAPAAAMQRSVSGAPLGAPPVAAAAPGAAARPTAWGGGSMLGTVASTAAGVVAGSFLFQGIQGLMNRGENTAAADQQSQHAQLEDSPHTSGSLYENPSDDLNNLAEVEDTDSFAGDEGGGDFA